jgi:thiol:disulfide interchange protein DsbD
LAAAVIVPAASVAAEPPPVGRIAQATLLADAGAVTGGRPLGVALRLRLPAGWHTYWRYPGDAGAATGINWRLPSGFAAGELEWPTPARFATGPVVSYGYGGEVWLLSRIAVPDGLRPGEPVTLAAEAEWLVCADICIPEQGRFELTLPVTKAPVAPEPSIAEGFRAARERLPRSAPWPVAAAAAGDRIRLTIDMGRDAATVRHAWFFPDRFGLIDNARPQTLAIDDGRIVLTLPAAADPGRPPAFSGVVVLHRDGEATGYAVAAQIRS